MPEIEDIYDLIAAFKQSPDRERRIVAAILMDLDDRRGIKQELRELDGCVCEELGEALARLVRETP